MHAESLHENIAAISAEMHSNTALYETFYTRHGSELNGFPGIWKYCVTMAEIFTRTEEELFASNANYLWIDNVTAYCTRVLQACYVPSEDELYTIAREVITEKM